MDLLSERKLVSDCLFIQNNTWQLYTQMKTNFYKSQYLHGQSGKVKINSLKYILLLNFTVFQ